MTYISIMNSLSSQIPSLTGGTYAEMFVIAHIFIALVPGLGPLLCFKHDTVDIVVVLFDE